MTNKTEDNILKVNVAEDIKMEDMGLGGQEGGAKSPEDQMARYHEEVMVFLKRYVAPHRVKSRWVMGTDIERVIKDGGIMLTLCTIPRGMYGNISAIAHPQIDDRDPLRFFVLVDGKVIINPVIIDHTKVPVFKDEGCMSYPETPIKKEVPRYNKITVRYQTLVHKKTAEGKSVPVLSRWVDEKLSGNLANVFQHEIHHLNQVYIYDEDFKSETVAGFGDGLVLDLIELTKKYEQDEPQTKGEVSEKNEKQKGISNPRAAVV